MSERVQVLVKRVSKSGDGEEIPVVVWSHEIPLLEEIHGVGAVNPVPPATKKMDIEVRSNLGLGTQFKLQPEQELMDEWNRLVAVYGMHPEFKVLVVEKVYQRHDSPQFLAAVGDYQPTPEDDIFETMELGQLRKWLVERGVQPHSTWNGVTLRAKCRELEMKEAA